MFADEQIKDKAELDQYLQEVEAERERLLLRLRQIEEMSPETKAPALPALTEAQWRRLVAEAAALWSSSGMDTPVAALPTYPLPNGLRRPEDGNGISRPEGEISRPEGEPPTDRAEALNLPKYELLKALGVQGRVSALPRIKGRLRGPKNGARKTDANGQPVEIRRKRVWGRVVLSLEIAALGLTGERRLLLTESEEAFRTYARWVYNSGAGTQTRFGYRPAS